MQGPEDEREDVEVVTSVGVVGTTCKVGPEMLIWRD
jgi:hypothetical protein